MYDEVLAHHGIKGQKWGVRRFQNEDGTRTAAGKARERNGEQVSSSAKSSASSGKKGLTDAQKAVLKKVAIGAGVAAAAGLAVYGAVKYSDAIKDKAYQESIRRGTEAFSQLEKNSWINKYMDSDLINEATKGYAKDYHDAVKSHELMDIEETAKENSSTYKKAKETLKGAGRYSNAELNALGISTADTARTDFESTIKNRLKGAEEAAKREKELADRAAMTRRRIRSLH